MPNLQALFEGMRSMGTSFPTPADVYNWTQTWWFTSTLAFVALLWCAELIHRGMTNDRGDIRPAIQTLLSALSLVIMWKTVWVDWQWTDFAVLWETVNGPVLRLCLVRYLYGSMRNTTAAAGRTLHIWMIVGLIRVCTFTVGQTTLQRRQEAVYIGMPVDDFNFVPILHMVWAFELCDLITHIYSTLTVPAIQTELIRSIRTDRPPMLGLYAWAHWLMSWCWLTVRVLGFGMLTIISTTVVSGMAGKMYFTILTLAQMSLWWDLRNLSPAQLRQKWAHYTFRYAQRTDYNKKNL